MSKQVVLPNTCFDKAVKKYRVSLIKKIQVFFINAHFFNKNEHL